MVSGIIGGYMPAVIPSLTTHGWTSDPLNMGNIMLQDYFLANFSQSKIYQGRISSVGKDMQAGGEDGTLVTEAIQETLTRYFRRYFADVTVRIGRYRDTHDQVTLDIKYGGLHGQIPEDPTKYDISYAIREVDGYAAELIQYNNEGTVTNTIQHD